jgi:uncharacterized membrane protein YGL010W
MIGQAPSPPSPPSPRRPVPSWLRSWLQRHRHPFNLGIHLIGIPLAVAGVVLLFLPLPWYWGVGAFVLGYLLQYVGHAVEGNDVGEWALIKRLLGLPYVAVSPRWQKAVAGAEDRGEE